MPPEAEELLREVEQLRARLRALEGEHRTGDAEEALRRSEARLAACIQITPYVAIQWYDAEGRVLFWNRASERVFGWPAEEARGKTLDQLIHTPQEAGEFRALLGRVHAQGHPFGPAEFAFKRRDGSTGQCISTVFEIPAPAGEACFVCMDVDITERKQAEEALRRSEERCRRLLDLLPDAVWLERAGRIEWANRACLRLLGAEQPEQVIGRPPRELFDLPPSPPVPSPPVEGRPLEMRLVRLDGTSLDVEVTTGPGDPEGLCTQVVLRDVTGRKRMEEALRHSQKMEAVGRLAGGVAHDFNNLLTAIQATCEVLLRGTPPESASRPLLEEIRQAGERAAALTGQLLAFSRKQLVAPRVLDPNRVIQELAGMLRRLIGEDVGLALELDPAAGTIRADPAQFEQVLLNLALNGRDAMPQGGTLRIATRRGEPHAGREWVEVDIQDSGLGMDEATRLRLFEPFFTTKEPGKGTGLGLATVYAIVEQCGGTIRVDTAPGRGTTMTLRLPASEEAPTQARPDEAAGAPRGSETILVVEDDPQVRRVTARALRELGYQVLEAVDGDEALELSRGDGREVDLLLTDVVMPRMSGRELARRLQSEHPGTRVLFASGYTDDTVLRHGIQQEELDFLPKPFSVDGLARKVRQVLDRTPG